MEFLYIIDLNDLMAEMGSDSIPRTPCEYA